MKTQMYDTNDFGIDYRLSSVALNYLASEAGNAMGRNESRRCSEVQLVSLLHRAGLPVTEPVLDYERRLGGWSSIDPEVDTGFGIYLSLQEGVHSSATAELLVALMTYSTQDAASATTTGIFRHFGALAIQGCSLGTARWFRRVLSIKTAGTSSGHRGNCTVM